MRRTLFLPLLALTVLGAAPLPGQAQEMQAPSDWKVRFDQANADPQDLYFVTMTPGWHITTGPAAILWNPAQVAEGNYRLEAEIHLFDPGRRREAFGVFFGGSDLEGDGQAYTYFLIRRSGEYLVKTREGAETGDLVGWTANDAILPWTDDTEGDTVLNTLTVEVGAETVRFLVNGTEVQSLPRSAMGVAGVVGLRVNHALNLHVTRLDLTPM
jgi:hypothetical protein